LPRCAQCGRAVDLLERPDGTADPIDGRHLQEAIFSLPSRPTLAVVNSCQSAGEGDIQTTLDNEDAMAWALADRALAAARDSGYPQSIAIASRAVAIAMRRQGHHDAAVSLLTGTALELDADRGRPAPAVLGAYGALLCTAFFPLNGRVPIGQLSG
jgi:hypothetical protein